MRFLTVAIVFAAAHVALAAPVYSLARGTQDGVSVVIPDGNDVVQRDYYDKYDLMMREPTLFAHDASHDPSRRGLFARASEFKEASINKAGKEGTEGNREQGHTVPPKVTDLSGPIGHNARPDQTHEELLKPPRLPTGVKQAIGKSAAGVKRRENSPGAKATPQTFPP
ncbi:hypothetical protein K439DRAFT_1658002 [Ramaria rubella]|nr:hypothetical protein K439DRAFT_1658002 [Ramaria rubella]